MRSLLQLLKGAIGQWKKGARVCDENEPLLPISDEVQRSNGPGDRPSPLHKFARLPRALFPCASRVCLGAHGADDEVLALESDREARIAADTNHMAVDDHIRYTVFI